MKWNTGGGGGGGEPARTTTEYGYGIYAKIKFSLDSSETTGDSECIIKQIKNFSHSAEYLITALSDFLGPSTNLINN